MFDVNDSMFYSIEDLIAGAQYILSLDSVHTNEPAAYRELKSLLTRWHLGDVNVLAEINASVESIKSRLDMVADPAKDPIRTLCQQHGWESPQDVINGSYTLLQSARTFPGVDRSEIRRLSAAVVNADTMRKNSTPVTFGVVNTMCEAYNILRDSVMLKSGVLDLEVPMYEKHNSDV